MVRFPRQTTIETPGQTERKTKRLRRRKKKGRRIRSDGSAAPDPYAHHKDWDEAHERAKRRRRRGRKGRGERKENASFYYCSSEAGPYTFVHLQPAARKQEKMTTSLEAIPSLISQVEETSIPLSNEETSHWPPYGQTKGAKLFLLDLRDPTL